MPWDNVPEEKWDEMESCVQKVMDGGKDKQAATAICYESIVGGKSLEDVLKTFVLDGAIGGGGFAPSDDMLITFGG
jgi:hypothetical protein